MTDLNQYGDKFCPTENGRGVDIASQRQDALDRDSLAFIAALAGTGRPVRVLDLGGGYGAHAIRMANAGADVTMIDAGDMASDAFAASPCAERLHFVQKDFSDLTDADVPRDLDMLYSQRAIHYVPYDMALRILSVIRARMKSGGRIYISAAGWDSEYGASYPDRAKPVEQRFTHVAPGMREKHGIAHKIVTYKEDEFARLLQMAGFSGVETGVSAFGNIKAEALKA